MTEIEKFKFCFLKLMDQLCLNIFAAEFLTFEQQVQVISLLSETIKKETDTLNVLSRN